MSVQMHWPTVGFPDMSDSPQEIFLVFGDSHAVIWEGSNVLQRLPHSRFEHVQVSHLGPALAFNLMDKAGDGLGKWGEQIFELLSHPDLADKRVSGVMLCFGEIDIRTQVVGRAMSDDTSIEQAVAQVFGRVLAFAARLHAHISCPVLLWEPVPTSSTRTFVFNPNFPSVGSEVERNYATACASAHLRAGSQTLREQGQAVYAFGAFEQYTHFLETREEFFEDGCHLNLKGLGVALACLTALCQAHQLDVHRFFTPVSNVLSRTSVRDIARYVKVTLSSEYARPSRLLRLKDRDYCFHTEKQEEPFAMIDIGYATKLEQLIIYNRFDAHQDRARTLQVLVGDNLTSVRKVFESKHVWGEDGEPLAIGFKSSAAPVRFIMLRLMEDEFFHLGQVHIMVRSFQRP
jgi:hypothetical protein